MSDIAITWPMSRSLGSYILECDKARQRDEKVFYRISSMISEAQLPVQRSYMVHEGFVRGWMSVVDVRWVGPGQVRHVSGYGYWPAGFYVIRNPIWHPIRRGAAVRGFRGFRYVQRDAMVQT